MGNTEKLSATRDPRSPETEPLRSPLCAGETDTGPTTICVTPVDTFIKLDEMKDQECELTTTDYGDQFLLCTDYVLPITTSPSFGTDKCVLYLPLVEGPSRKLSLGNGSTTSFSDGYWLPLSNKSTTNIPYYKIQAGDVLRIVISDSDGDKPDRTMEETVRPDGRISFFGITKEIGAKGLTVTQLQELLNKQLLSSLKMAAMRSQAMVSLIKQSLPTVSVVGKVVKPGEYKPTRDITTEDTPHLTVSQALALAGGLALYADKSEILVYTTDEKGTPIVRTFNYNKFAKGPDRKGRIEEDIVLKTGDRVVVN